MVTRRALAGLALAAAVAATGAQAAQAPLIRTSAAMACSTYDGACVAVVRTTLAPGRYPGLQVRTVRSGRTITTTVEWDQTGPAVRVDR